MENSLFSLLPLIIMQSIYAIFIWQIAKRTNKNAAIYLILSLIPVIGTFFFIYVFWSTILLVLDSINELKASQKHV